MDFTKNDLANSKLIKLSLWFSVSCDPYFKPEYSTGDTFPWLTYFIFGKCCFAMENLVTV